MERERDPIFTRLIDTDTEILRSLDDKTLYNMGMVNKYAYNIIITNKDLLKRFVTYKTDYNNYMNLLNGINPRTGRRIQIGGPVYTSLIPEYKSKI